MRSLLLSLALALFGTLPAQASLFCEIKPTRDGFVALRDGPGPTARLVGRMRPGDEVMLGQGRQGAWTEVVHWRGGRWASGQHPTGDPPTARGWMHEGLIAPDSCG